jgi:hypothetical protein
VTPRGRNRLEIWKRILEPIQVQADLVAVRFEDSNQDAYLQERRVKACPIERWPYKQGINSFADRCSVHSLASPDSIITKNGVQTIVKV